MSFAFAQEGSIRSSAYEEELIPSWAETSIKNTKEAGIMVGKDDGNFYPYDAVNRAQMVTILLRMKDIDLATVTGENPFTDVPSGTWYEKALIVSLNNGWVKGRTETTFEPSRKINRAEFAVLIARVFEIEKEEGTEMEFEDVTEDDWFYQSVKGLYAKNLIRFPGASNYDPDRKFQERKRPG